MNFRTAQSVQEISNKTPIFGGGRAGMVAFIKIHKENE